MTCQDLKVLRFTPPLEVASFAFSFNSVTLQHLGQTPSARVTVLCFTWHFPWGREAEKGALKLHRQRYNSIHFTETHSYGVLQIGLVTIKTNDILLAHKPLVHCSPQTKEIGSACYLCIILNRALKVLNVFL